MTPHWRFALLGERVAYTKSPNIFSAIADFLSAEIRFEVLDCDSSGVLNVVKRVTLNDLDGLSVTIPYKEIVCSYLNQLSEDVKAIGAVNCVTRTIEGTIGHNTDWDGFLVPLKMRQIHITDARILILGSGGAARAVAYALSNAKSAREIVILSRDEKRIHKFTEAVGNTGIRFQPLGDMAALSRLFPEFDVVVNATPLGGGNAPDGGILLDAFTVRPGAIYYDLNYNGNNALIRRASECGAVTIDGSGMLVAQALKSFELWTGTVIPFEPIFRSVFGGSQSQAE